MVLYLFDLDLEEEFQKMQESNKSHFKGLLHHTEESILVRVVMIDGRSYRDQGPPERGRYQGQTGRPPDRRNNQDRGYSGRGYTNQGGRPPG